MIIIRVIAFIVIVNALVLFRILNLCSFFSYQMLYYQLQELESLLAEKDLASEMDADKISDLEKEVQNHAKTIEELESELESTKSASETNRELTEAQEKMQHLMSMNENFQTLNSELIRQVAELRKQQHAIAASENT